METNNPRKGLHLYTGRAGTGAREALFEGLKEHMRRGERAILLVPEQETYRAEAALAAYCGGLLGIQVLSADRLCERILSAAGDRRVYLNNAGYHMVIERAALQHREKLKFFKNLRPGTGFAEELAELFANFKQSCITPEALQETASAMDEAQRAGLLGEKLTDIALLYGETERYLSGKYLTREDSFTAVLRLLPSGEVRGCAIYADGLPAVNKQVLTLMEQLLLCASSLTLALTLDEEEIEIFEPNLTARAVLRERAEALGIPCYERTFRERKRNLTAPGLDYLEKHFGGTADSVYPAEASEITFCASESPISEVRAAGEYILSLVRKKGKSRTRYRDIALIVGDEEVYGPLLLREFTAAKIPCLFAESKSLRTQSAVEYILQTVRAVASGFTREPVLSLVKTGCTGASEEDIEEFENYILRTGVQYNGFEKPFEKGEDAPPAERVRSLIMPPLVTLRERLKAPTAGEKIRALYACLEETGLCGRLQKQVEELTARGLVTEGREAALVWNAVMGIFSQMDGIMGEEAMDLRSFLNVLEAGICSMAVTAIPDTADKVQITTLSRAGALPMKHLILLGCSEGALPKDYTGDGLINDAEQRELTKLGLPGINDSSYLNAYEQQSLYEALSAPTESLYISYAFSGDGGELIPSGLYLRLSELFPHACRTDTISNREALPCSEAEAARRLQSLLCLYAEEKEIGDELPALYTWFMENRPTYLRRLTENASCGGASLPEELARSLYGRHMTMSCSRLETFNKCPFKHFAQYGLSLQERKECRMEATDMGTLYHDALETFFKKVQEQGISLQDMTEEEEEALIESIIPELLQRSRDGLLLNSDRLRPMLLLVGGNIRRSIEAAVRHMLAGDFRPLGMEVPFGPDTEAGPVELCSPKGSRALLHGFIDRLDAAETPDGRTLFRVVDYKTGGRELRFEKIRSGETLQLPMYMAAALQLQDENGNAPLPAGLYYMPVKERPVEDGPEAETKQRENYRLAGLTVCDGDVIAATERGLSEKSGVIDKLKITAKGEITGCIEPPENMDAFLKFAKAVAEQTLDEMLSGRSDAHPTDHSCDFCPYRSLCRFDLRIEGCRINRHPKEKEQDFFNWLMNGSKGDTEDGK